MATPAGGVPSIGVDIGGTKVLAAVVDEAGRVVDTATTATPGKGSGIDDATAEEVEDALVSVIGALTREHGRCTVGVAAAGFVDAVGERVRFAPHLPWRDEPLAQRLTDRLGHRVVGEVHVDNDANAALWAEVRFGVAGDAEHVVMITLGTGIGGALLLGGALHRGRNGMAGELGHMQVVPDGRLCECGGRGCWEQYCSGRALGRAAAAAGSELSGPLLTEAAQSGDPAAVAAYDEVGRWLGVGAANVAAAVDPELVVVGGGVSAAGELLLAPARRALAGSLVGAGHRDLPELVGARLGPLAGVVGVADLARDML
ncbi:ROK family protein [Nocardioides aurantiacus]|uniref:Glucokinase n=1 Tax=Nocardioides aurantiacus TaxID=86796 RepID=A0A3N2CSD9_9ACTN|nr:ROK family protein [Nocardioides aurantiacus]ROR90461.1 glucokinase [Nocardioides aurantiacus]